MVIRHVITHVAVISRATVSSEHAIIVSKIYAAAVLGHRPPFLAGNGIFGPDIGEQAIFYRAAFKRHIQR
ncbi:hypothetical protein D3C75_1344270 [compost metagenome]